MNIIENLEKEQMRLDIPDFKPGDTVKVHTRNIYGKHDTHSRIEAVARAIVSRPKLVLADEPTANVDSETAEKLLAIMEGLNRKRDVTFVFSTVYVRLSWPIGTLPRASVP